MWSSVVLEDLGASAKDDGEVGSIGSTDELEGLDSVADELDDILVGGIDGRLEIVEASLARSSACATVGVTIGVTIDTVGVAVGMSVGLGGSVRAGRGSGRTNKRGKVDVGHLLDSAGDVLEEMEDGVLGGGGDLGGKKGVVVRLSCGGRVKKHETGLAKGHEVAVLTCAGDMEDEGSLDELGKVRHEAGEGLLVCVGEDRDETVAGRLELGEDGAKLNVLVELLDLELCVELGGLVDDRRERRGASLAGRSDVDEGSGGKGRNPGDGASSRNRAHVCKEVRLS